MTFAERFHEIRTGFERPFWVANVSELFERLSYYAAFASLPATCTKASTLELNEPAVWRDCLAAWCGFWQRLAAPLRTGWDFAGRCRWLI